jgi:hypothetical protein
VIEARGLIPKPAKRIKRKNKKTYLYTVYIQKEERERIA